VKVRWGDQITSNFEAAQAGRIARKVEDGLLRGVFAAVVDVNDFRLRRLAEVVELAANIEADELFDAISGLIERKARGVNGADLMAPYLLGSRSIMSGLTDKVEWADLKPRYKNWKARRFRSRMPRRLQNSPASIMRDPNHFVLSGRLKNYLGGSARRTVMNRFGRVEVTAVDEFGNDIRGRNRLDHPNRFTHNRTLYPGAKAGDPRRLDLGGVKIKIFPKIASSLLPMLSSGRWTDGGDGRFEHTYLTKSAANKLVGNQSKKGAPFRPLVLPVTQFFMLNRIPGVVMRSAGQYINRAWKARLE
jgi:hypothetical protein